MNLNYLIQNKEMEIKSSLFRIEHTEKIFYRNKKQDILNMHKRCYERELSIQECELSMLNKLKELYGGEYEIES